MVYPGFIYRLTTLILWVAAATRNQDLLGVSETPRGFCTE